MSSTQILATIQNLEIQLALLKSMVVPSQEKVPSVKKAKKTTKESTKESATKEPATKEPAEPKEKKVMSEGVRLWNVLIKETLEEMKASGWTHPETGKPVSRKDAMAAASANKKTLITPKEEKAPSVASEECGAESEGSKKGPKKGSHWSPEAKVAAAAKRAAKKTLKKASSIPLPGSPPSEAEDEMVKTIISGKTYFINSRTNAAFRDGSYEGLFDGSKINTEVAEPI